MLILGVINSRIQSYSEFLIDTIVLLTVIVYSLYITNVLSVSKLRTILWYVLLVPVGIAWGSVVLLGVDVLAGTNFYNGYFTIQLFLFAVIIGMIFEGDRFSPFIFRLYFLTGVVYTCIFLVGLIGSGTGTSKLIFLAVIFSLGVLKKYRTNGLWNLSVK